MWKRFIEFLKSSYGIKSKIFISFKLLAFIFFNLMIIFILKIPKNKNLNTNEICLCTVGKEENAYILEYVEHYKSLGLDKIYLYDNNNIDGEKFEDVIDNYIKSGFVEIVNFRGKKKALMKIANDCYRKNHKKYDWLIFYEIDEFLHLRNHTIKSYLYQPHFNHCEVIYLNWVLHTDNNKIYYENKTLKERFPEIENNMHALKGIKSILRGGIPNIKINCIHRLNEKLINCDGYGRPANNSGIGTLNLDLSNYYIDHYTSKSTEELAKKINKGDALYSFSNKFDRLRSTFGYNKVTKEKIDYLDSHVPGFNTSSLKIKLLKRLQK